MKTKYIFLVLSIFFVIHSFRNLLQFFSIVNFLTTIGHEAGINSFNSVANLFGLSYSQSLELPFVFVDLSIAVLFFILFRRATLADTNKS